MAPLFRSRSSFAVVLVLGSLSFLTACASGPKTAATPVAHGTGHTELVSVVGDARIGTYVSSWNGFRTSSYWIEGPTGLILIDTQFLVSAGEEMIAEAERLTGKKAVLAIILHPNPDKFNGTAAFQKHGIKVVTSAEVLSHIPAVHKLRTGWFYERFKPDYPSVEPKPESFGDRTTDLSAGGITVRAHVLGAGCSDAHVVVDYDGNVFVGDLVTIGFHSWLELGQIDEWLKRLEEIRGMNPKIVRTGRGGTGEIDAIDREQEYLETVEAIVKKHHPRRGKVLTSAMSATILDEILERYPAYDFPKFVENGLAAVWARLAK